MDCYRSQTDAYAEGVGQVPAFGRGLPHLEFCAPDLAAEVMVLASFAAPEDQERLAQAVSLRGAELVHALLALFEDQDEALAALEDYAGAFDDLTHFAGEVLAERFPLLPTPTDDMLAAYGATLVARGEVLPLRLGDDLHLFWRV